MNPLFATELAIICLCPSHRISNLRIASHINSNYLSGRILLNLNSVLCSSLYIFYELTAPTFILFRASQAFISIYHLTHMKAKHVHTCCLQSQSHTSKAKIYLSLGHNRNILDCWGEIYRFYLFLSKIMCMMECITKIVALQIFTLVFLSDCLCF